MPYGFPDIVGFYDMLYGTAGVDLQAITVLQFGGASGIVFNGNPPFTVTDFIGIYAKFIGPSTPFAGIVITAGSTSITGLMGNLGCLTVATLLTNNNGSLAKDTIITAINPSTGTITISQPALQNDTTFNAYCSPITPLLVMLTYINLARVSVMAQRYKGSWFICMCYFVAHYLTLWTRSESGVPNITAAQVAASGLTKGVTVSRAAGDVSATQKLIMEGYDEFGAWGETTYGEMFITIARATNMGPIYVP